MWIPISYLLLRRNLDNSNTNCWKFLVLMKLVFFLILRYFKWASRVEFPIHVGYLYKSCNCKETMELSLIFTRQSVLRMQFSKKKILADLCIRDKEKIMWIYFISGHFLSDKMIKGTVVNTACIAFNNVDSPLQYLILILQNINVKVELKL